MRTKTIQTAFSIRMSQIFLRTASTVLLVALPMALLQPYWRHALPEELTHPLMSAVHEISADGMPQCEQFIRYTDVTSAMGPVVCETSPAQIMV